VGGDAGRPSIVERLFGLVGNLGQAARLIGALLVLTAAAPAAAADFTLTVQHDGLARTALVHVPAGPRAARPVVVNFHGGGGNADSHRRWTRMDAAADRHGFVAVYPNGTGPIPGKLLVWNAGTCCGRAPARGVDDVGFVLRVLDALAGRVAIERNRIYATGLSNGSMMAQRLAAEAADRIAAVAPVAGAMALTRVAPVRAMPVMHFHSVDDPRALYGGGLGPPFPGSNTRVMHMAVEDSLKRWIDADGCRAEPSTRPGIVDAAGHSATYIVWEMCRDGVEVVLWRLTGAGHVWPGAESYLPRLLGPPTKVLDANEEMWRFFERFTATVR
jgi:polyhydroxybutyrate depolymerase